MLRVRSSSISIKHCRFDYSVLCPFKRCKSHSILECNPRSGRFTLKSVKSAGDLRSGYYSLRRSHK